MLVIVGTLALTGMVLKLVWFHGASKVSYAPYLVMGWVAIIAAPALVDSLTGLQLGLIVAGGLAYTIGFPVWVLRRPDVATPVSGYHERVATGSPCSPRYCTSLPWSMSIRLGAAGPSMFDRFVVVDLECELDTQTRP